MRQSSGAFSGDAATTDQLPELLAIARTRPLTDAEARLLADALRRHEPWLEWSGKREKPWFEVELVALHMHERISNQANLRGWKAIDALVGSRAGDLGQKCCLLAARSPF